MDTRTPKLRASMHGFSLTEILVAMVIALIGIIIIFQVFAVSEDTKRTSTSGGDAQQAGSLSLFLLERDLRQAGYGMSVGDDLGCNVHAYDEFITATFNMDLSPVVIQSNAADVPDVLTVLHSSSAVTMNPTVLFEDQAGFDTEPIKVKNTYGFNPGDVLLVVSGTRCMLAQATSINSDNVVEHVSGNYTDVHNAVATARYNKPGGFGLAPFLRNSRVYDLGSTLIRNTYSIVNNQMTVISSGSIGTPSIADNIVMMKAQYGMDNGIDNGTVSAPTVAEDGIIDQFTANTPTTTEAWKQVIAVRLAVVARSSLAEKPSTAGGPCDTTPSAPLVWHTAGYAGLTLDLTADANWQCYRYKVFETTVPLRNQIWRQS